MSWPVASDFARGVLRATLVAVAYFAGARLGYAFALEGTVSLWPPAGLMLGVLAMSSVRRWPWLIGGALAGSVAGDLMWGFAAPMVVAGALANALVFTTGAYVLRRLLGSPVSFSTVRSVLALGVGVVLISNAVTAVVGGVILSAWFDLPFPRAWFIWWAGDGLGMLIVAPVIIAWTETVRQHQWPGTTRVVETILLLVCLFVAAPFALGPQHAQVPSGPYLLFPLLLWAALRFGPVGAATSNLIVASAAIWHASLGQGPFAGGEPGPAGAVLDTYAFLAVAGIWSLIAATAVLERQTAHAQLRQSREQYRKVVETATDAIITIDRDSRILFANAATGRIFGYTADELLGQPLTMLMPPEQRERHMAGIARYLASGRRSIDWQGTALTGRHKDGREIPLEVSFGELVETGRHEFTGILRDISEKRASEEAMRALEEQYRQSHKMEAIGELAGGIAHDFNNLLLVVQGNTEMVLDELGGDSTLRPQLEQVQAAAQRAAALTRQLLAFSRRQILEPRVVDLSASIVAVEPMLKRLIGEHVMVAIRVGDAVGPVLADPGQVEQVIVNLAINARDAMPQGGVLTIELTEEALDAGRARRADLPPGRYVCLAVSDTGVGMDAATAERIFEPFFTTKPMGRGTGLGLSTVHGIVKQSGGGILLSTAPGQGSTFHVYLPRVDSVPAAPVFVEPRPLPGPRSATILVVEDEADVGRLTRRILERARYRVLLAATPSEAIQIAADEADIQLLLSDVVLPEMSGRVLATRLLSSHPHLEVLFMSGYTDEALSKHGVLDPGVALIEKPFSAAALLVRVDEMLRRQRPGGGSAKLDE